MTYPAPTNKVHLTWWASIDAHLPVNLHCYGCGRTDSKAYVQPQHPFWAQHVEGCTVDANRIAWIPNPQYGLMPGAPERIVAAQCGDCIGRANSRAAEARKAALAAMPKCEACGKYRGTVNVGRVKVLLCGRCWRTVRAEANRRMAGVGGMALFLPPPSYSREDVLSMAGATR